MSPLHDRGGLPVHRGEDDSEDGSDVRNPKPRLSQDEANAIAIMAAGMQSPPVQKPWALIGAVIAIVAGIVSALVGVKSMTDSALSSAQANTQFLTQLSDRLTSFGERLLSHDARLGDLEKYQREGSTDRAAIRAYNGMQDERLQNLTKALEQERQTRIESETDIRRSEADLRSQEAESSKVLSDVRADLKVLVDRAQRPRTEIPQPERDAQAQGPQFHPR